jgi:hypothetical protein
MEASGEFHAPSALPPVAGKVRRILAEAQFMILYLSVSCLKQLNIKLYKSITLPLVLYFYEACTFPMQGKNTD